MACWSSKGSLQLLKILINESCKRQIKTSSSSVLCYPLISKEPLSYQSQASHSQNAGVGMQASPPASPPPLSSQYSQTTQYEPTLVPDPSPPTSTTSISGNAQSASPQHSPELQLRHSKQLSIDTVVSELCGKNPEVQFSKTDLSNVLLNHVDPRTLSKVFYFDSLAFTKRLEAKGFTRDQAEACVECLLDIIGNTLEHQAKHMITKSEQKIAEQQLQTEIMSVKKDMVLLQKSEFSALRTETEKISSDIARVQSHFEDEVVKLKGQFTLDVNLERGRAVEAHAASEKSLQMLNNKIDMEIAHLKTTYEVYRNDIFKYAAGTVLTCTTLIIGFIRLWK